MKILILIGVFACAFVFLAVIGREWDEKIKAWVEERRKNDRPR